MCGSCGCARDETNAPTWDRNLDLRDGGYRVGGGGGGFEPVRIVSHGAKLEGGSFKRHGFGKQAEREWTTGTREDVACDTRQ